MSLAIPTIVGVLLWRHPYYSRDLEENRIVLARQFSAFTINRCCEVSVLASYLAGFSTELSNMSSETAYLADALANSEQLCTPARGLLESQILPTEPTHETLRPILHLVPASDESLIEQVRTGEQEALGHLFRRHARTVRYAALRILRDEAEATVDL